MAQHIAQFSVVVRDYDEALLAARGVTFVRPSTRPKSFLAQFEEQPPP